ncbi:protein wings apart-like isoform X2 [Drosophila navojoa]|uniref:protein wings apart-like isoform X2 n=1 Tax=Drosophila navojoa TaxID=7232 RepID=UPI0011BF9829|nr:protein wings apart-like isoform X2 [Drosophila navojoa]
MSRWGKNIVVPLDSLCKEKENTNRPTVARSVGTVGKWGKMGFTSTRTYTLSALHPMAAAAAAAAAAASPAQSPASTHDHDPNDMSVSVPEPPKPKKFFKSRNTAPPEVIAQIIQQLPHCVAGTSPMRDQASTAIHMTPTREPIKLKLAKGNSAERKRKSPKKKAAAAATTATAALTPGAFSAAELGDSLALDAEHMDTATGASPAAEPKGKKKKLKEEKKLKPEAPPSRILGRARKAVNYCEVDEDERYPTPIKDLIIPKTRASETTTASHEIATPALASASTALPAGAAAVADVNPSLPPPTTAPSVAAIGSAVGAAAAASSASTVPSASASSSASRTPEHPPIVLRISKGTSRLVSTDSEEPPNCSPAQQHMSYETPNDALHDHPIDAIVPAPKITVKPLRQPPAKSGKDDNDGIAGGNRESLAQSAVDNDDDEQEDEQEEEEEEDEEEEEEPPEINYCTVKISPDKPPKERLKLIIKTDVIRNAIAKAAAKSKSKKHKHLKHAQLVEQVQPTQPVTASTASELAQSSEFKTPSPHLALANEQQQHQQQQQQQLQQQLHRGSVISPTTRSDHDFDSQSSVLGSISSKGNSTPQLLAQAVQEDSCVIRSRGSSVITSDLETSQHSSLVAPPSDIESRLESMMMTMDGANAGGTGAATAAAPAATAAVTAAGGADQMDGRLSLVEQPLQQDILAVLRGDEVPRLNGADDSASAQAESKQPKRATRGRARGKANNNAAEATTPTETRTRARAKPTETSPTSTTATATTTSPSKRATRARGSRRLEAAATAEDAELAESPEKALAEAVEASANEAVPRRGRAAARAINNNLASSNNNNSSSNNNNINKIAANLSAKAEASRATDNGGSNAGGVAGTRSYGRKRKNQQVTQLLQHAETSEAEQLSQELSEAQPTPAKVPHTELDADAEPDPGMDELSNTSNGSSMQHDGSSSSPPPRDFKFKDKFKRTLTLDNQVPGGAGAAAAAAAAATAAAAAAAAGGAEPTASSVSVTNVSSSEETQRGAVKLVISKKKGSIFKSRALVPSDQAEQATVAKRALYKHSWDAALEANGAGTGSDASNASASTAAGGVGAKADGSAAGKAAAIDAIYGDFGDSNSNNNTCSSSTLRGESPALGKLSRLAKPQHNAQSLAATSGDAFDMDMEPSADEGSGGGAGSGNGSSGAAGGGAGDRTGLRVDRKTKEYYTVVRNVKTAHQIQEIGEYQEMYDDVEYILDALQPHNPPPTRCLSALQLATKCMTPAFRMHVRAHGVVTKFFKALSDANQDLSLGLCTSAIMYILSQEGLNMDLDRDSLELMINLLEAEGVGVAAHTDRPIYERNKQKVRELCEEIKAQGKGTHLNVESITVGTLAMETLLSLTSKRAGEWFKEDLRKLGGLEHIIKTISNFCDPVIETAAKDMALVNWEPALLDNMQTVARCLRVLENVTQHNEANQRYMLTYANGRAVDTLCFLYRLCDRQLLLHPSTAEQSSSKEHPGVAMRELLIPVMKVLINLTHTFNEAQPSLGAELLGKRSDVIETSFHLLLLASNYIPDRCVFELSILVLTLLINLCMHTAPNRATLMQATAPAEYVADNPTPGDQAVSAVQALLEYFYKCEELARLVEKNTDAFLESNEKSKKKQEEVEETVNNLVQRAGHHMEHTLKGSYAAILIGNLITDNEQNETIVRQQLRGNSFKEIIGVLEKYHTFMNLTSSLEAAFVAHMKSTKKIIDNFKKRDYIYEHADEDHTMPMPLNLETTTHHHHHQQQAQEAAGSTAVSNNNTNSSSNSSSSTNTTTSSSSTGGSSSSSGMPRVFKTYSSHR